MDSKNLILFMRVLCPVYFVCMAVAVGSISAIAFYNLALFLIFLVELVILKWIRSIDPVALLMEILNNLTEEEFLSKAAELLRLVNRMESEKSACPGDRDRVYRADNQSGGRSGEKECLDKGRGNDSWNR